MQSRREEMIVGRGRGRGRGIVVTFTDMLGRTGSLDMPRPGDRETGFAFIEITSVLAPPSSRPNAFFLKYLSSSVTKL